MCGLFGYVGESYNPGLMIRAAREAGRRGPHAYGFAYEGEVVRGLGSLSDKPEVVLQTTGNWLIGNARMATFGGFEKPADNQPLVSGSTILAHNGNVYDHQKVMAAYRYEPQSAIDSEALLAAVINDPRWREVLYHAADFAPQAALLRHQGAFYFVSLGHPLYVLNDDSGHYLCSRSFDDRCQLLATGIWEYRFALAQSSHYDK